MIYGGRNGLLKLKRQLVFNRYVSHTVCYLKESEIVHSIDINQLLKCLYRKLTRYISVVNAFINQTNERNFNTEHKQHTTKSIFIYFVIDHVLVVTTNLLNYSLELWYFTRAQMKMWMNSC